MLGNIVNDYGWCKPVCLTEKMLLFNQSKMLTEMQFFCIIRKNADSRQGEHNLPSFGVIVFTVPIVYGRHRQE